MVSPVPSILSPPPLSIAQYEIQGELGRGTTGVVFEARDSKTGAMRAVKLLRPDADREGEERRSRFLREAQTTVDLLHPNIARVYEVEEVRLDAATLGRLGLVLPVGEDDAILPYLSMERVAGEDLERRMARGLELDAAIDLLAQILDALDAAHSRNIVHRDLKPGNIMVTPDGRAKLLDFGLAKQLSPNDDMDDVATGSQLTLDGMVMGSLPYLAPEQLQGDPVRRRGDLFSLGVLAYELFTGVPPFPGNTMLEFARALLGPPPPPPTARRSELPAWIDEWVMPMLSLDPADRPASADIVRRSLERLSAPEEPDLDSEADTEVVPVAEVAGRARTDETDTAGTSLWRRFFERIGTL
ncbi:MAG: serine/threonine-protein kinase [Acidobacteriota bacterium]